jgi:sensor domain CHASE-containing protein
MKKRLKRIIGKINLPLVIFLLLVGGLLLVANIKSEPIKEAKQTVNKTVNNVSKTLNAAAQSDKGSVG